MHRFATVWFTYFCQFFKCYGNIADPDQTPPDLGIQFSSRSCYDTSCLNGLISLHAQKSRGAAIM